MKKVIVFLFIGTSCFSQNTNLINGVFIVNKSSYYNAQNCNSNQLQTNTGVAAYFTYTPSLNIQPSAIDKAGNVKFNNNPLNYDNVKKYYTENTTNTYTQQNWKVSGHNVIPNMNFNYNGVLPNFNINVNLVNDTLKKSDTLFINLTNIQTTDSIIISVSDNNNMPTPHRIALVAPNYANTYYLPPTLFATLITGPSAVIKIEAVNYNYQTISGKRYLFRNIFNYTKAGIRIIN